MTITAFVTSVFGCFTGIALVLLGVWLVIKDQIDLQKDLVRKQNRIEAMQEELVKERSEKWKALLRAEAAEEEAKKEAPKRVLVVNRRW